MSQLVMDTRRCKGCGLCAHFCPRGALALSEELNGKGYRIPVLDGEKCVQCGVCHTVCPDNVFELLPQREGGDAQ